MISLEALQAIDSIDRKGSFAAAAEELFKVPSALTYTIKKVEEQLNIKLFDRNKQRAKLTPTGKLLLERGREILKQVKLLEEQAKRIETGWETELRIVVDTILPTTPLWPILKQLMVEQPWLNLQLSEEALSGSWEALVTERADLVIGVTGDEPTGAHWHKEALGQISTSIVCSNKHPAASLNSPISRESLKSFTHIVVADSAINLPQRNVGLLGLNQVLSVANMDKKYEALIHGAGISHLPDYLAKPAIDEGLLTPLVIDTTSFPQTLFMAWPKHHQGQACQWLRTALLKEKIFTELLQ
ncbi:MAG: LysR substrate-binding domain-containing protein [Cellvibrionaceae bacterium]